MPSMVRFSRVLAHMERAENCNRRIHNAFDCRAAHPDVNPFVDVRGHAETAHHPAAQQDELIGKTLLLSQGQHEPLGRHLPIIKRPDGIGNLAFHCGRARKRDAVRGHLLVKHLGWEVGELIEAGFHVTLVGLNGGRVRQGVGYRDLGRA